MNNNRIRKSIAGLVLASGLVAGSAGLAAAETGSTTAPATGSTTAPATQEQRCQKAEKAFDRLKALDEKLHDRYANLVKRRDQATDAGKTELAAKITKRLDLVKDRDGRIDAKLKQIHDKTVGKCPIPEPNPTPVV